MTYLYNLNLDIHSVKCYSKNNHTDIIDTIFLRQIKVSLFLYSLFAILKSWFKCAVFCGVFSDIACAYADRGRLGSDCPHDTVSRAARPVHKALLFPRKLRAENVHLLL